MKRIGGSFFLVVFRINHLCCQAFQLLARNFLHDLKMRIKSKRKFIEISCFIYRGRSKNIGHLINFKFSAHLFPPLCLSPLLLHKE